MLSVASASRSLAHHGILALGDERRKNHPSDFDHQERRNGIADHGREDTAPRLSAEVEPVRKSL